MYDYRPPDIQAFINMVTKGLSWIHSYRGLRDAAKFAKHHHGRGGHPGGTRHKHTASKGGKRATHHAALHHTAPKHRTAHHYSPLPSTTHNRIMIAFENAGAKAARTARHEHAVARKFAHAAGKSAHHKHAVAGKVQRVANKFARAGKNAGKKPNRHLVAKIKRVLAGATGKPQKPGFHLVFRDPAQPLLPSNKYVIGRGGRVQPRAKHSFGTRKKLRDLFGTHKRRHKVKIHHIHRKKMKLAHQATWEDVSSLDVLYQLSLERPLTPKEIAQMQYLITGIKSHPIAHHPLGHITGHVSNRHVNNLGRTHRSRKHHGPHIMRGVHAGHTHSNHTGHHHHSAGGTFTLNK